MRCILALSILLLLQTAKVAAQTTWVVSNMPGFPATFTDLQAAINDNRVVAGDILLVNGSNISYGDIEIAKRVTIMGPGYYLNENSETQTSLLSAKVSTVLFKDGSAGSLMQGIEVNGSKPREVNLGYGGGCNANVVNDFGSFSVEINTSKITLMSNLIAGNLVIFNSSYNIIRQNLLSQVATSDNSTNNTFHNNLINGVVQDNNSNFLFNYIGGTCGYHYFNNTILTSNIIMACLTDYYCAGWHIIVLNGTANNNIFNFPAAEGSTNFGDIPGAEVFINSGSSDGKFKSKPNSIAAINGIGPFAGSTPYRLSGISLHPNIFSVTMPNTATGGSGLKVEVKVRAND